MLQANKGKLIVLYGINNLGKSTQVELLLKTLNAIGHETEILKYPIYNLEPTGPEINKILRSGEKQKISELELQKIYAQNRHDYQPELKSKLELGINIIAEDYIGTGLAWGVTKGADLVELEKQNQGLIKEDIVILLDGKRFLDGKEKNHIHEQDDKLMNKCRQVHLDLAKKYNWQILNANQMVEKVAKDIWKEVEEKLTSD